MWQKTVFSTWVAVSQNYYHWLNFKKKKKEKIPHNKTLQEGIQINMECRLPQAAEKHQKFDIFFK